MDTLLENGTYALDERGLPIPITGLRALIQRLLIRLSVRKGSFLPDPNLGSELHRLPCAAGEQTNRLALHYAQQALLPEPQAKVEQAFCYLTGEGGLAVRITVNIDRQRYPLEVVAL
ncbi:MAG TPA: histidine kinase [Clostridiales bacterium]|nr:histidine kinase [Clostridiales bacterium]